MFGLGARSKTTEYGVIIDIGSGSVGVAVVASDHTKKLPQILYAHRNFMRISTHAATNDSHLRQMREALFSSSLILSKEGLQALHDHDSRARITSIFLTCSSPWAHTIARNVRYETEDDLKVTESLIHDLVTSAEAEIGEVMNKIDTSHTAGFEVVERATVDVRINDYTVQMPIGLKGHHISLSHVTGLVPREILEAVSEVQSKLFTGTNLRVHTFMLVMYCILRDLFPQNDSLCIVDITGEATEIGIVENGLLLENIYGEQGSSSVVRDMMAKTSRTSGEIMSLLTGYTEGKLTPIVHDEIESYLQSYENSLIAAFTKLLEHHRLPKATIVTAHRGLEPVFKASVEKAIKTVSADENTILTLQPGTIQQIIGESSADTYLALACRFFHKLHACGEIESK